MSLIGALREGWSYATSGTPGPRRNETIMRGSASFSASATKVVTVPGVRSVNAAFVTLKDASAPTNSLTLSVGSYSNNTFTVFAWSPAGTATPPAAPAAATVSVGSSVFSYTSGSDGTVNAPAGEWVVLGANGATSTWTLTRGAFTSPAKTLTSIAYEPLTMALGDVLALTYSAATPTMITFPFPAAPSVAGTTPAAASNSLTFEWIAFCYVGGTSGY